MSVSSNRQTGSGYVHKVQSAFCSHPAAVGESYFEHQRMALGFAAILAGAALAALVHAIVPALCENTARQRIAMLHERLQARSESSSD